MMKSLSILLVGLVVFLHLYFLVLEMFLWTKPLGLKIFRQTQDQARASATLAANQGLYNGFLAAGLIWAIAHPDAGMSLQLKLFFLSCVIVAGAYGAFTVNKKILFIQAVPALLAMVTLFL